MTIRAEFKTYQQGGVPIPPEPEKTYFESEDMMGGLITQLEPENLPPNSLQVMKNGIYVRNRLARRNGLNPYAVSKPDSKKILSVNAFKEASTGVGLYRFTPNSIYRSTSSGWVAMTGPSLDGTVNDPISFTVVDNRGFFSNNGANVIRELLPASNTYAALGNAPKYKYLASAFNRVVGASLRDTIDNPIQTGWSGDLNYAEWDPTVDISAGFTPLVNTPADTSDEITGLVYLDSSLCYIRQRSIWLATNNASATNPFNFFPRKARIGCDCPNSVVLSPMGLIFYSFQEAKVYVYDPENNMAVPEEISKQITRALKTTTISPQNVFASYNSDTHIYSLFLTSNSSQTVTCYSFNFETKNWVKDEYFNISSCNDLEYSGSDLSIDDLSGDISALAGTIDSLGGLTANSNRFIGYNSGELTTQPLFESFATLVPDDNGVPIPTSFTLPPFTKNGEEVVVKNLQLLITPYSQGSILIEYSKDNATWLPYRTVTVSPSISLSITHPVVVNKPIRTRGVTFRLSTSDCMFTLNKYRAEYILTGNFNSI